MKARDLFIIILKIFGIYLIKDVLVAIPPVLENVIQMLEFSGGAALFSLFVSLLVLGIYTGIVYLLLFNTAYLVSKLNLTTDLNEEPMVLNLHRSSVYTIAIIVTGLVILALSVPQLVRQFYYWYTYRNSSLNLLGTETFDYSHLLVSLAEVVIGLLFLGNQRTLVNFIESRSRKAVRVQEDS